MSTIVDYASGPPPAAAIRAAGHIGAVRYLSPPRPGTESWMTGKPVHRVEVDDFDANGLKIAFVWQFGKEADADVKRGYQGGVADAQAAQKQLDAIQCSGHPVYFAVDYGISVEEWNSFGAAYFRGAAEVLGKQRVGIYGHSKVCHWAGPEDDVVAKVENNRWLCWITKGWSTPGETGSGYGVLYQRIVDTKSNPGPQIAGVTVDVNDIHHSEWGWRALPQVPQLPDTPIPVLTGHQFPTDSYVYTNANGGWRDVEKLLWGIFHTTENSDATPPENVAKWQQNVANESSYNVLFGAVEHRTVRSNDDDRSTWSTGNIANSLGVHASCIGRAKRTRQDWLDQPEQLADLARWAADCQLRYGWPLKWLTDDELRAYKPGFTDHAAIYRVFGGPAYRWDPGTGFPHDIVLADAQKIIDAGMAEIEGIMAFWTEDESREALRILRDLDTNYNKPLPTEVKGSNYSAPFWKYGLLTDRKVEEMHIKQFSEPSEVQKQCDAEEAQGEADMLADGGGKEATDAQ